MRQSEIGCECDRAPECGDCAVKIAKLAERVAVIQVAVRLVRRQGNGAGMCVGGKIGLAEAAAGVAEVGEGGGESGPGLQADRALQYRDRLLELIKAEQGAPQIGPGCGEIGPLSHGALKDNNGLFKPVQVDQGRSEIVERLEVGGIDQQRPSQRQRGLSGQSPHDQQFAEIAVGVDEIGFQPHGRPIALHSLFEPAGGLERRAERVVRFGKARLAYGRLFYEPQGGIDVAAAQSDFADQVQGVGVARLDCDDGASDRLRFREAA